MLGLTEYQFWIFSLYAHFTCDYLDCIKSENFRQNGANIHFEDCGNYT